MSALALTDGANGTAEGREDRACYNNAFGANTVARGAAARART
jgi:hypothetical protein